MTCSATLRFASFRWSTILAIAFCGIDFAGIARLFTPEQGADEPKEVWYLFGAWLLAATMNAALTWWGVSIALVNHQSLGGNVVAQGTLVKVVPIFVAVMVWLIRILIIGTFSVAGDRLFSQADARRRTARPATSLSPSPVQLLPQPHPYPHHLPPGAQALHPAQPHRPLHPPRAHLPPRLHVLQQPTATPRRGK